MWNSGDETMLRPPQGPRPDLTFRPHSPTAEALGLNPGQCGFDSRCGYALIAQSGRGGGFKPRMLQVRVLLSAPTNSVMPAKLVLAKAGSGHPDASLA